MPIAFKEWAVTVRALAEGEQLLTLRKGGIREPSKHFALEHDRFFLYPTFDHQRNDLVRESQAFVSQYYIAEGEPWGFQRPEMWQGYQGMLLDAGVYGDKTEALRAAVEDGSLYTNALLPQ